MISLTSASGRTFMHVNAALEQQANEAIFAARDKMKSRMAAEEEVNSCKQLYLGMA